jgi:hypothetical protein
VPRHSPFEIILSTEEQAELVRRAASYTLPYATVMRAKMILLAATGLSNDQIAAKLGTRREIVSRWRKRFFHYRLAGLDETIRRGRPPKSNPVENGFGSHSH